MSIKYKCGLCESKPEQLLLHKNHLETLNHKEKRSIFSLQLKSMSLEELEEHYNSSNMGEIIERMETKVRKLHLKKPKVLISNKEALKDKIHELHNFLRNHGGGYGMNALKVFNIIYGLKKIEENNLIDSSGLIRPYCEFSYILDMANKNQDEELAEIIQSKILDSIADSKIREILFYEIPKNILGSVFSYLIKEIQQISEIEKSTNTQLCGKIYEYFIGRDQTAISELGAYFTDRHITDFIYQEESVIITSDLEVPTMCDPFGGSGGFTVGYILYLQNKYPKIDWSNEIKKVHHYDMNEDVIKSAALEFFCLTGQIPNMKSSLRYANSFTDEFENKRYMRIFTNPPYGGDNQKKNQKQSKRDKVKKYIKEQLITVLDKNIIARRLKQLRDIKEEETLEKKIKEDSKVTVSKSSSRIQAFAKKYGLKGNNKEAVSLIQLMDLVDVNGTVVGVLKEGVFFSPNKTFVELRKCLVENFNVRKVISVPADQFDNTTTKTSIIVFDNTVQKTSVIEFSELIVKKYSEDVFEEIDGNITCTCYAGEKKIPADIQTVTKKIVASVSVDKILNNTNVSFNGKDYNIKLVIANPGYKLLKIKDIYKIEYGGHFETITEKDKLFSKIGGGANISNLKQGSDWNNKENTIIISRSGSPGNVNMFKGKTLVGSFAFTLHLQEGINDYETYNRYCYYYLKSQEKYLKLLSDGSVQKNLNRDKLSNFSIAIPITMEKIKYWVTKIQNSSDTEQATLIGELGGEASH